MRILAVRGRNIAPINGEFSIEITAQSPKDNEMESIACQKNASQSGVINALNLALFLLSDHKREQYALLLDDSLAFIESKVTDVRELFDTCAEVDFVSDDGECFRSRWYVYEHDNKPGWSHCLYSLPDHKKITDSPLDTHRAIENLIDFNAAELKKIFLCEKDKMSLLNNGFEQVIFDSIKNLSALELYQSAFNDLSTCVKKILEDIDWCNVECAKKNSMSQMPMEKSIHLVGELSVRVKHLRNDIFKKTSAEVNFIRLRKLEDKFRITSEAISFCKSFHIEKKEAEAIDDDRVGGQGFSEIQARISLLKKEKYDLDEQLKKLNREEKSLLQEINKANMEMEKVQFQKRSDDERFMLSEKNINDAKKIERELLVGEKQMQDNQCEEQEYLGLKIELSNKVERIKLQLHELQTIQYSIKQWIEQHECIRSMSHQYERVEYCIKQIVYLDETLARCKSMEKECKRKSKEIEKAYGKKERQYFKEEKKLFLKNEQREVLDKRLSSLPALKVQSERLYLDSKMSDIDLLLKNFKESKKYQESIQKIDVLLQDYEFQKNNYLEEMTEKLDQQKELSKVEADYHQEMNQLLIHLSLEEQRNLLSIGDKCPLCKNVVKSIPDKESPNSKHAIIMVEIEKCKKNYEVLQRQIEHAREYLQTIDKQVEANLEQKVRLISLNNESMEQSKFIMLRITDVFDCSIKDPDFEDELKLVRNKIEKQFSDSEKKASELSLVMEQRNRVHDEFEKLRQKFEILARSKESVLEQLEQSTMHLSKIKEEMELAWSKKAEYLDFLTPVGKCLGYDFTRSDFLSDVGDLFDEWDEKNIAWRENEKKIGIYNEKLGHVKSECDLIVSNLGCLNKKREEVNRKQKEKKDRLLLLLGKESVEKFMMSKAKLMIKHDADVVDLEESVLRKKSRLVDVEKKHDQLKDLFNRTCHELSIECEKNNAMKRKTPNIEKESFQERAEKETNPFSSQTGEVLAFLISYLEAEAKSTQVSINALSPSFARFEEKEHEIFPQISMAYQAFYEVGEAVRKMKQFITDGECWEDIETVIDDLNVLLLHFERGKSNASLTNIPLNNKENKKEENKDMLKSLLCERTLHLAESYLKLIKQNSDCFQIDSLKQIRGGTFQSYEILIAAMAIHLAKYEVFEGNKLKQTLIFDNFDSYSENEISKLLDAINALKSLNMHSVLIVPENIFLNHGESAAIRSTIQTE